ncbi:branched-chain amino acid ABC transporter permease [Desulfurella multipotens]|uniref:branched-chain amino acid ABC transporter permease n=1 Tax=Desulfurella TaxID=33001 RepID=UPI0003E0BBFF|nr:branched-chain amino acid ABC transporter permease [Desulfurella multipotens]AHF97056.1 branched-chain amino acid ABC transporter permease [Desulfurella acetivorans A63]PMP68615.1 MAG: branched-chain amino acid ABC transporter permease [Desulfurella multipotens]
MLTTVLQQLINGLSAGSLYALVAIGYTMVYGVLRMINFAHGDILMVGAYLAFFGISAFMLPWWVSFITAIILTGFVGVLVEKLAYKPIRNASRVSLLITAVGVSFFLENLFLVLFGGVPKAFPIAPIFHGVLNYNQLYLPVVSIYTPIVALVLLYMLLYILHHTKYGMAMRSIALDIDTTSLMGINVDIVISLVFFLGSSLAAVGGILWSTQYPSINPLMGIMPGLKAFAAAVLGGIGDVAGAAIGGLILGISEVLIVAFFPSLAGYKDAFAFLLLILVLLFKPTGIMGKELERKRF